jgi:hypothetical protein
MAIQTSSFNPLRALSQQREAERADAILKEQGLQTPEESLLDYNPATQGVSQPTAGFPRERSTEPQTYFDQEGIQQTNVVPSEMVTSFKGEVPPTTFGLQPTGEEDVAGRPIQQVVPKETDMGFLAAEDTRLSVPNFPADFSTMDTAEQTLNALNQQGFLGREDQQGNTTEIQSSDLTNAAQQISMAANKFSDRIVGSVSEAPQPHFAENIDMLATSLGVTEQNLPRLGTSIYMSMLDAGKDTILKTTGQVDKNKDILGEEETEGELFKPSEGTPNNKILNKDVIESLAYINKNLDKQPYMFGFYSAIFKRAHELLQGNQGDTPSAVAGEYSNKNNIKAGAVLAADFFKQGYFELARTKNGDYFPVATPKLTKAEALAFQAAEAYNLVAGLNAKNQNIFVAQRNPSIGGIPANKVAQFIRGKEAYTSEDITDLGMALVNYVSLQTDPQKLAMMQKMAQDVMENAVYFYLDDNSASGYGLVSAKNVEGLPPKTTTYLAYSDSIYASTMLDFSKARFNELIREHKLKIETSDGQVVNPIVSSVAKNKALQVGKHLAEYLPSVSVGLWYGFMKKSDMTHRAFQRATNVNWINHAGTIRAGLGFGNKPSLRVTNIEENISTSKGISKGLTQVSGSGKARGEQQLKFYSKLSEADQLKYGSTYILANAAHELGLINLGKHYSFTDMVNAFDKNVFDQLVQYGQEANTWLNQEGAFPTNLPDDHWFAKVNKKKEWFPIFDAVTMAYEMNLAEQMGGKHVTLRAIVEKDSSQSNAFIQALSIGDLSTMRLLGANVSDKFESEFKNLREKAASTVSDDINEALSGEDERDIAAALTKFFDKVRAHPDANFSKLYARGIVVAGLYGKHPSFMFKEVEDMLAGIELLRGMESEVANIKDLFGNDEKGLQELHKTIASVYAKSFKKHMPGLSAYQRVMKSLATVVAATYGSSMFKTYGGQLINMAGAHGILTEIDKKKLFRMEQSFLDTGVQQEFGSVGQMMPMTLEGQDTSVMPLGVTKDIRASGDRKADRQTKNRKQEQLVTLPDGDQEYGGFFAGNSFRDAFAVLTTQSGDSFMWFTAVVAANKFMGKQQPLNTLPIHDAVLADSLSVIPFLIAYNNIAPYDVTKEAKKMWKGFQDHTLESIKNAKKIVAETGRANIGDEGLYSAVSGYFDRLWHYSHSTSEDVKKKRKGAADQAANLSKRSQEILAIAEKNGWIRKTESNRDKRYNLLITPTKFNNLIDLMLEAQGLSSASKSVFGISGHNNNTKVLNGFIDNISNIESMLAKMSRDITNMR